jgi:hypothetical protein
LLYGAEGAILSKRVVPVTRQGAMSITDKETLHLLSIFHYIMAGIIALLFCLPLLHLAMGITLTVGGLTQEEPALGILGAAISVVAGLIILTGWGLAFLVFLAGKNLDRQAKYQICLYGAGVLCVFIPMGTVLGVFTLVTLQEESIRKLFNDNENIESQGLLENTRSP